MTLLKELEEDKAKLAELEAEETTTEEENDDGSITETIEETDGNAESGETEEGSEESDEEEKPEKTVADHARERRQKAQEEKRQRELERQIEELKRERQPQAEKKVETSQEPDINKDPVGWLQWNNKRLTDEIESLKAPIEETRKAKEQEDIFKSAVLEFNAYEGQFRTTVSDYDDVANYVYNKVAESIKVINPTLSEVQVAQETQKRLLINASNFVNDGLNPAEELYHMAREQLGYKDPVKEQTKDERPDLSAVAKNRKRSAGMAGSGGSGGSPMMSMEKAASLSPSEWSKMTYAEKEKFLKQG